MATEQTPAQTQRIELVHCNECGHDTRHAVVGEHVQDGSEPYEGDPDITLSWRTTWAMLECRGCESVRLRRSHWFSEWDPQDGEQVTFLPPSVSRREPPWLDDLPEEERELLDEIYRALHAGAGRLVTMGTRALIDMMMDRHVKGVSTFAGRLAALEAKGLVGKRERELLEAALEAGHAASHRGHAPSRRDVETLVDVVEHALQAELLVPAARRLRKHTPGRRKRPGRRRGSAKPKGQL